MLNIADGKKIASEILQDLEKRVKALKKQNKQPALAVVLVGDDKPSHTYVRQKQKAAEQIGVEFYKLEYPANIGKDELIAEIKKAQKERKLSGLIVQLPVPESLWPYTREIVDNIDIRLDVDCLSHCALGRVMMNVSPIVPPTPGAIMEILKYYQIALENKHVCLIGRGDLIGRPLASMLTHEKVALSVHGRGTRNLADFTQTADIIITGVGQKNLLTGDMVKDGVVVIDAGITFTDGKIGGDIDFDSVAKKASLVTPVPGGVGPVTVAKLLENVVISCERD